MKQAGEIAVQPFSGYNLDVRNGVLFFEGVNLSSMAARYGSPLFVYSERMLMESVAKVKKAFGEKLPKFRISYAVKASSNLRTLRTIREQGAGAEVVSEGEIFLALMAGFKPGDIIFNGPAKSDGEFAISAKLGLYCINLDSVNEMERLYAICKRMDKVARVSFRVRPDVEAGTKSIQTGTHESKFGLDIAEAIDAYRRASDLRDHLEIAGVHAHVGSQNTSLVSWAEYVKKLAGLAAKLKRESGVTLRHINIGGGIPVKHASDSLNQPTPTYANSVPSEGEIAGVVSRAMEEEGVQDLELIVEPGRRIVANAALLVSRVISSKPSGGQNWIYVDAGYNILPSAQIPWYYHILPVTRAAETELLPYRVAGPLCDNHDLFHDVDGEAEGAPSMPRYRMLPKGIGPDDLIAFLDVGAYNMDVMDNFNGRLLAGGVFIDRHGKPILIRRRQKYEDLLLYESYPRSKSRTTVKRMKHG